MSASSAGWPFLRLPVPRVFGGLRGRWLGLRLVARRISLGAPILLRIRVGFVAAVVAGVVGLVQLAH
eukprot:12903096-Alexandrium_andersonii.AAC.1